jgi:hypothetical protein
MLLFAHLFNPKKKKQHTPKYIQRRVFDQQLKFLKS